MEVFNGLWNAHIQQGKYIMYNPALIQTEATKIADSVGGLTADRPHHNDIATTELAVQEHMKACFMLSGPDRERCTCLKDYSNDSYPMGHNEYPINTADLLLKMNNLPAGRHQEERGGKPKSS